MSQSKKQKNGMLWRQRAHSGKVRTSRKEKK